MEIVSPCGDCANKWYRLYLGYEHPWDENIEAVDEENVIIPEDEYKRRNTNARHWVSCYI